jgi:hypothetical protein
VHVCVCVFLSKQVLQAASLTCLLSENACTRAGAELRFFDAEKQPDGVEVLRAKPSSWFGDEKVWFECRFKSWWIVLQHEPWHLFVPTSARACEHTSEYVDHDHDDIRNTDIQRTLIFNARLHRHARLRRHAGGNKTNVRAFLVVAK